MALYVKCVCNSSMKSRYQFRIYPTDQQQKSLAQLFGCVRVVWNDALALAKSSGHLGFNRMCLMLTQIKKNEDRKWLNDVSNSPLQQSLKNLDKAYKNFFDSQSGKRKGKKLSPPKFKKRTGQQSATFVGTSFKLNGESIHLTKIGDLKPIWSRDLPSSPSSVTVIKDCAGRYFLSFVVEVQPIELDAENQSIGIDLGIKTFAFMSNGEQAHAPDYKKLDRKIRRKQRKLARQVKGSNRRDTTRLQIAKLHNRQADRRKDFLHKLSTKVVRENQVIVLEDLNVSGMMKNRKLSRSISMQGWREFKTLLEGKSIRYGREFQEISRWEPTSQICSSCGFKWGRLDLKVREIKCLSCGTTHDRDGNASKNIEKVGMGNRHDSKWTVREHKSGSPAIPCDPPRITAPLGR
jgi:putative transposase